MQNVLDLQDLWQGFVVSQRNFPVLEPLLGEDKPFWITYTLKSFIFSVQH